MTKPHATPSLRLPAPRRHGVGAAGPRTGFGLVELLIVMVILLILVLITLRIRSRWKETSEIQACTASMAFLRNAAKLYEQAIPVPLKDSDASGYFVDLAGNGTKNRPLTPMEYFIFRASGVPGCQAQLERLPETMFVTEQTPPVQVWKGNAPGVLMRGGYVFKTVVDPWGRELKYRASSAAATEADPAMPAFDYAYFASAGPDGLWGTLTGHDASQRDDDAADNIYMTQ